MWDRDGISLAECCCCGGSSDCGSRILVQLTSDIREFKSIAAAVVVGADRDKKEKKRNYRFIPGQVIVWVNWNDLHGILYVVERGIIGMKY